MEEFSEELYLFDNTILDCFLYKSCIDVQKIHAFHITRQAELLKSCVDDLWTGMNWAENQHEYYQIIYIEKVGGGNGGLSTEVGNETPFSTSCDKREWRVQRGEEHNSSAK